MLGIVAFAVTFVRQQEPVDLCAPQEGLEPTDVGIGVVGLHNEKAAGAV